MPPAERVLLGAPDRGGPTQRWVFVADPRGQIERIAAIGHLVAWSVRTPADRVQQDDDSDAPLRVPERSVVVVADERAGGTLRLEVGRRWVRRLRMLRGPGREPQVAIEACADRKARQCATQLVTLGARPLRVVDRGTGATAAAAVAGEVDAGRRVSAGAHPGCAPRLRLSDLDATHQRTLPAVRFDPGLYNRCTRFDHSELHGHYVLAWIDGKAVGGDVSGLEGTTVAALDVDAGPRARWRAVQYPYRSSAGSTGLEIGPAVTGSATYWEELDEDGSTFSLELATLPGTRPTTTAAAITPNATTACDLAATTDAIYELTNARCSPWSDSGRPADGAIHRITNPVFRPEDG